MITRDGAKMSKSKGNTVSPADYVERFGADSARAYVCFMGPPERGGDWSDEGVEGVHRFLARLWRAATDLAEAEGQDPDGASCPADFEGDARVLAAKANWAIDKATGDFSRGFQFNTVIAAVMELVNEVYRTRDDLAGDAAGVAALRFAIATAASLIQPFAPHLAAEVWEMVVGGRVWEVPWPEADPAMLISETATIVIQVNGKVRDRIEVPDGIGESELLLAAREAPNVVRYLEGTETVKEVVVPGKLVNLVVKPA
jgi:leucyl-tRNA synthetase